MNTHQPTQHWRQGDVILTRVPDSLDDETFADGFARPEPSAWTDEPFEHVGETGKKHRVEGKGVKKSKSEVLVRVSGRGRMASRAGTIIKAPEGADIVHPDHRSIHVPPGTYIASPERDVRGVGAGGD